jgi:hypothetical protein
LIGVLAGGAYLALIVGRKTEFFGVFAQRTTTCALSVGRKTGKIGKLTRGPCGALCVCRKTGLVGALAGGTVFALIFGGKAGLVGVLANGTVSFASFFGTVVIVVVYSKSTRWATLTGGGLKKRG